MEHKLHCEQQHKQKHSDTKHLKSPRVMDAHEEEMKINPKW